VDRQEFEYRVDQIKKLYAKKDYKTIASIADKVEWKKVKSASLSSIVAEAYDNIGEYAKAKSLLLLAYERGPITRQLLFRLSIAAVRDNNIPSAIDFYKEFVKLSPDDPSQYILKFEIAKASKVSIKDQIKILEAYTSLELDEKWQVELAKLYHANGQEKKCIDLCDEIILWYREGESVDIAKRIKAIYQPETVEPEVEEQAIAEPETEAVPEIPEEAEVELAAAAEEELPDENEETIVPIVVPVVDVDESESETLAEDDLEDDSLNDELDSVIDEAVEEEPSVDEAVVPVVLPLVEPEEEPVEEDLVDELAEEPIEEAAGELDEEETTEVDYSGLEGAPDYLVKVATHAEERLDVDSLDTDKLFDDMDVSYEDLAINELEKILYMEDGEGQMSFRIEELLQNDEQIEGQMSIADLFDIYEDRLEKENNDAKEQARLAEEKFLLVKSAREEAEKRLAEQRQSDEEKRIAQREENKEETDQILDAALDMAVVNELADANNTPVEEEESIEVAEETKAEEVEEAPSLAAAKDVTEEAQKDVQAATAKFEPVKAAKAETAEQVTESLTKPYILNEQQKELFGEHLLNEKMEPRICDTIGKLIKRNAVGNQLTGSNLVITGDGKSGKTTLIVNIIKVANRESGRKGRKIAKAQASSINGKNIADMFEKLTATDIIIENAGKLKNEKIEELAKAINDSDGERLVVLEDTKVAITKLFRDHPVLRPMFNINLNVDVLSVKQWAEYAKKYAKSLGYDIDEMGMLALHVSIGEINRGESRITTDEVKDIIDDAIENAQRKGIGKIFSAFSHKEKDSGAKVLREQDFI